MKSKLPKNGSEWRIMLGFRLGKEPFNPIFQDRTDGIDDIIKAKEKRNEHKKVARKHR